MTVEARLDKSDRFEFGRNWLRFLEHVDEERVREAERSLQRMLGTESLAGKSFLDIGSGSGLFSLAALRLGAARVFSFDYDAQSVACTREMKRRWNSEAEHWTIERGSILDRDYVARLGTWDVVYSWGVLHHTGAMSEALANAAALVASRGLLFIAIYNDQGTRSRLWHAVKRVYNRGIAGRAAMLSTFIPYWFARGIAADLVRFRNPVARYARYKRERGMSMLHDWIDWLGGYPFEVARPEDIFRVFRDRGFSLREVTTCGSGLGCNEYVFRRDS
ncbi:MAG TPA: methyltransferase domain-containing protein [Thermoanaerobaculia bacterium]|nr:methyltransferase domain-containing protein [Thermoanaerobaculia bacterium]